MSASSITIVAFCLLAMPTAALSSSRWLQSGCEDEALQAEFFTAIDSSDRTLINVVVVLSIAYFAFHVLWGMNYYRQPITWKLNIQREYTLEELVDFTVNVLRPVTGPQCAKVPMMDWRQTVSRLLHSSEWWVQRAVHLGGAGQGSPPPRSAASGTPRHALKDAAGVCLAGGD